MEWLQLKTIKPKHSILADNLFITKNNEICFEINVKSVTFRFEIVIINRKSKEKMYLDFNKRDDSILIPISQFTGKMLKTSRWDMYLEHVHDNSKVISRIEQHVESSTERISGKVSIDNDLFVVPYMTKDHKFAIYICSNEQYLKEKYPGYAFLRKMNMDHKSGQLSFKTIIQMDGLKDFKVTNILLRLRHDHTQQFVINEVEVKDKSVNKKEITCSVNLNNLHFQQFYWDVFVAIQVENGEQRVIRIVNDSYLISKKLKHRMLKYTIHTDDNYQIYPYITMHGGFSITYRQKGEYEALKYKVNEYVAFFLYRILFWYFSFNPIWLIHEKYSETAQDNGFYFFKDCYENHYSQKIYYVIKKDSQDAKNLVKYKKRVVYFMSIKHLLLLIASKLIISSETKGHGYAWRVSRGVIRDYVVAKKFVFLQHGILGLKKVENTFKVNSANSADLFIVSSDFEKEIVEDHFDYHPKNIAVTGLARWDVLEDKSKVSSKDMKEILLMPTWRNWLEEVEDEKFMESDYYQSYSALLQSKKLNNLLKENNVRLNFYIHPKFMPYVPHFHTNRSNVRIIQFGDEKVNDLIMRSSLLITDYSSVAWEMHYLKKPVLFFQFDLAKYNEYQGAYLDLENDLFGEATYEATTLVDKIEEYIHTNFKEKPIFTLKRDQYFKYNDKQNSSRIFREIKLKEKDLVKRGNLLSVIRKSDLIQSTWFRYKKIRFVRNLGSKILSMLK